MSNLKSRLEKLEQKTGTQEKVFVNWNITSKEKKAAKQFLKDNPDGFIISVKWIK